MVASSFVLEGKKCTVVQPRDIPVQSQSFGYDYKENIATHVQNKLRSINSAQKFFLAPQKLAPEQVL